MTCICYSALAIEALEIKYFFPVRKAAMVTDYVTLIGGSVLLARSVRSDDTCIVQNTRSRCSILEEETLTRIN